MRCADSAGYCTNQYSSRIEIESTFKNQISIDGGVEETMAPRWGKKKKPPVGFDYVEPILEALENELRDKVKESNEGKRKTEALWPVHQINWQKSRYIYDLYYTHKRISRQVYDYCINQKIIDAPLIAKWKKPGYERLCCTYVINPTNYKFGTTSICRVPLFDRSAEARSAQDPTVSIYWWCMNRDRQAVLLQTVGF